MGPPHQLGELPVHHANKGLARREGGDDLGADSLFLDPGDEILDDRQGDVGFQQGHAHLAQGILDVVFGEAGLTPEGLDDFGQARGEVVQHDGS